jgi:solute carrier family 25 citrate transporter 1
VELLQEEQGKDAKFVLIISVYATMPFDVVKTKMQGLNAKQYKGTIDCFIQTVKKDTIFGLWKGTTPRLGRVCCSSSIIFASYEQVMKVLNIFWKTD